MQNLKDKEELFSLIFLSISSLIKFEFSEVFEELSGTNTSSCVNSELEIGDFLVDFFHELDDKIHDFVFVHIFYKHVICKIE